MRGNCNLDERQLWVRGNVYKHTLIIMGVLLLLDAFLKDSGIIWASGMYSSLIILMFSIMIASVEMICLDVYMSMGNRQKIVIYLMGISSTIALVMTIIDLAQRKTGLVLNNQLTIDGSRIIMDLCILTIFIVFMIKAFYNKNFEKVEE